MVGRVTGQNEIKVDYVIVNSQMSPHSVEVAKYYCLF